MSVFDLESRVSSSQEKGTRKYRHFAPDGFSEEIWILFEGEQAGEELYDEICETLFSSVFDEKEDSDPVERFESSLKKINVKVLEEAVFSDDFLKYNSFFIGLFHEQDLHFTVLGEAEAYLIRDNTTLNISTGIASQELDDDLFTNIATGAMQDGDIFIFSTQRLLRFISKGQIAELSKNEIDESIHTLREFFPEKEGGIFTILSISGAPSLPFTTATIQKNSGELQKITHLISPNIQRKIRELYNTVLQNSKKEVLIISIVTLGLILIWSFISFLSSGTNQDAEEMKNNLSQLESQIGTAENAYTDGRQEEAIKMLDLIESEAHSMLSSGHFRVESAQLIKKVQDIRDSISKTQRIRGNTARINLATQKPSVQTQGIFKFKDELYAYDSQMLFRILINEIESTIPFKSDESVSRGIPFEKADKMLFLTKSGKVLEVSPSNIEFAKTEDEEGWKNATDIATFDKNIYILSPDDNQIWKYSRQTNGYSGASEYNKNGNLRDAISFTIDGSVLILNKDASVTKLMRGTQSPFELVGTPPEFQDITQIFTLPDFDLLFFLAPKERRIFIFRKGEEGATFDRQFLLEGTSVGDLSGLWVDPSGNIVYVSDDKRIHEISLVR